MLALNSNKSIYNMTLRYSRNTKSALNTNQSIYNKMQQYGWNTNYKGGIKHQSINLQAELRLLYILINANFNSM